MNRRAIPWCALLLLAPPVPGQETSQCVSCHRQRTSRVVEQYMAGPHARGDVGCVGCHGGDPSAAEQAKAHDPAVGYTGAIPHSAVPELCGKCHTEEMNAVGRSPHAPALRYTGAPSCVHCHHSHRTTVPASVESKCAECHTENDDPGRAIAGRMADLLAGADGQIRELDRAIAALNGEGADTKRRLLEVERERVLELHEHVQQVSHTLHLDVLGPSVDRLAESVRTASAVAHADLEPGNGFSRQTVLLIFAAIIAGLLVLSAVLAVLVFRLLRRVRRASRSAPREARA